MYKYIKIIQLIESLLTLLSNSLDYNKKLDNASIKMSQNMPHKEKLLTKKFFSNSKNVYTLQMQSVRRLQKCKKHKIAKILYI